jgi:hypothetical protein
MDAVETTLLLYLLDALQSAPSKSQQLLKLAEDGVARSEQYTAKIARLRLVANDQAALREQIKHVTLELR